MLRGIVTEVSIAMTTSTSGHIKQWVKLKTIDFSTAEVMCHPAC